MSLDVLYIVFVSLVILYNELIVTLEQWHNHNWNHICAYGCNEVASTFHLLGEERDKIKACQNKMHQINITLVVLGSYFWLLVF